jgi:HlyD family secretion protein
MKTSASKLSGKYLYVIGGVLLVIIVVGVYLMNRQTRNRSSFATRFGTVSNVTVADTIQTSGTLNAAQSASLYWKTSGTIEKMNIKVGDHVRKGDVLATLAQTSLPQSVISAQADLVSAQQTLADLLKSDTSRAQALIDLNDAKDAYNLALSSRQSLDGKIKLARSEYVWMRGHEVLVTKYYKGYADATTIANADNELALAKAKLDDAQQAYDRIKAGPNQADVAAAQASVDAAQATVNMASIIAPFDGDVIAVYDQPNDLVDTTTLAVVIANRQTYTVDAKVDESDIAKVTLGQPVAVTLDALTNLKLDGKVTGVNLFGQSDSGVVKYDVFVTLPSSETPLPLGATANLTIQVSAPTKMLAVPITAVRTDDQGEYILRVGQGSSPQRINVQSGDIVGNLVAVSGDLKEGDRVVITQTNTTSANTTSTTRRAGGGPFGPLP